MVLRSRTLFSGAVSPSSSFLGGTAFLTVSLWVVLWVVLFGPPLFFEVVLRSTASFGWCGPFPLLFD